MKRAGARVSSIWESIERIGANVTTAIVVAIGGGVMWVIRTLLTNQRQIELLQREIEHRDETRREDREALSDIRSAVRRLESRLMGGGE